jgi:hypothetical protein
VRHLVARGAADRPVVVGDYSVPSVMALGLYLKPDTPLRLIARCTQCNVEPPVAAQRDVRGFGSVFAIQATPPANGSYRWIDPQTFPARADHLNLFTAT